MTDKATVIRRDVAATARQGRSTLRTSALGPDSIAGVRPILDQQELATEYVLEISIPYISLRIPCRQVWR